MRLRDWIGATLEIDETLAPMVEATRYIYQASEHEGEPVVSSDTRWDDLGDGDPLVVDSDGNPVMWLES